ncbi:hypothetical protein, conserved [Trypanosoma brucei brucei TREU927]|uniref:Uncharacterized protein n=1 Tax=Trypanosoma brucei brucei (strain 927/4 GUTat10.1) TaxID=185431 RepID=Q388K8_TRYB2|nr:hypothetical protein, conserved [Trypanosoma brucei brucei TREU927]EAN78762.1 hypothetical protein, conserved [Trypanosoma brucei brucei TREU927]
MRRTFLRLGGGGGELFPTSKAAAHLEPQWVMERRPPPPPGPGKCYVTVHKTGTKSGSKWQLLQPHIHTLEVISMDSPPPHKLDVPRPTARAAASFVAGVKSSLEHARKQTTSVSGIAAANIAEKKRCEARMKTRDYAEGKRPVRERPGWEATTDVVELSEWLHKRVNDHRKIVSDNSNGYEREYTPWEKKPVPPEIKKQW